MFSSVSSVSSVVQSQFSAVQHWVPRTSDAVGRDRSSFRTTMTVNDVSGHVVDAAMRVHSVLGPGLLEGAYEACLAYELRKRRLRVHAQLPLRIVYDGMRIELGYRIDLLVEDAVVVELKAVAKLLPIHQAQLLSYLRLSGHAIGLLLNFHEMRVKDGIKRIVI
jgi:GxxExxY protein